MNDPSGDSARRRLGFFAGVIAAAAASLVFLVARLALGVLTPFELFVDTLTVLLPPTLFSAVLDTIGFAAKPLLMAFIVAGALLLGGALGAFFGWLLGKRLGGQYLSTGRLGIYFTIGLILFLGFAFFPFIGVGPFGRDSTGGWAINALSIIIGSIVFSVSLGALDVWARPADSSEPAARAIFESRRLLLKTIGFGALALGAGAFILRGVSVAWGNATSGRRGSSETGLPPEITPTGDFYTVSKNISDPAVDISKWRLEISGLVEKPYSLSYDELLALPPTEGYFTLECISNDVGGDLISNAHWKGVLLKDLLARAVPKAGVVDLWLQAEDTYDDSIKLDLALRDSNLIAYEMNNEKLTPSHGFPARLLVPGIFGMKNVKWLNKIVLTDYDVQGYWQQRGWSDIATYKTHSRIDVPTLGRSTEAGMVQMGGIAFSGDRGISRVEVSLDDGATWRPARLRPALSPYSWVLWTYDWDAQPGRYKVLVRAYDANGKVQESEFTPPLPDGFTGLHGGVINIG